jgi:hypothetical protein
MLTYKTKGAILENHKRRLRPPPLTNEKKYDNKEEEKKTQKGYIADASNIVSEAKMQRHRKRSLIIDGEERV